MIGTMKSFWIIIQSLILSAMVCAVLELPFRGGSLEDYLLKSVGKVWKSKGISEKAREQVRGIIDSSRAVEDRTQNIVESVNKTIDGIKNSFDESGEHTE